MKYIFFFLTSLLSAIVVVWAYDRYFIPHPSPIPIEHPANTVLVPSAPRPWKTRTLKSYAPTSFAEAAKKSTSAVVYIETKHQLQTYPWMKNRYGTATGSGVIISPDGYIATNNHVVKNALTYTVQLNDRTKYEAQLIGTDPSTDLALLKIQADSLPSIEFGNSDSLRIGEWVLAVGNPFSLQSTVTAGIVSAKGRNIDILREHPLRIESFIQTDAVVNPGNSGGALVNTAGQLVGINSAILSHSGQYEGYSFAIPSNLAAKILNDLKAYGNVQRGLLGVSISRISEEMKNNYNLPNLNGIFITHVMIGSGADDAGLKPGDVLLNINGQSVNDVPRMQELVGQKHPGDTLSVQYRREDQIKETKVILKNTKNNTELVSFGQDKLLRSLGIQVRDLYSEERHKISQKGVKVLTIFMGSPMDQQTNMVPGFIITHVNGHPIQNTKDLTLSLKDLKKKIEFSGVYEGHNRRFNYIIYP